MWVGNVEANRGCTMGLAQSLLGVRGVSNASRKALGFLPKINAAVPGTEKRENRGGSTKVRKKNMKFSGIA